MVKTIQWYEHEHRSKETNIKNVFRKDFFKLMNNAVFEKTIENVTKSIRYQVCNKCSKNELFNVRIFISHINFKKSWINLPIWV